MNLRFNLFNSKSDRSDIRVHHGYRDEVGGPFVKLERMNRFFPNHEKGYNLVYGVSGTNLPLKVLDRAKKKGIPVVCHMNSCWHPAYAEDYDEKNCFLKPLHNDYARFVVYGSHHAMEGARRYLGDIREAHRIVYNAVDVSHFQPAIPREGTPRILAIGLHQFRHRLEPLIRAMPLIEAKLPGVELVIAGKLVEGEGIWDCGETTVRKLLKEVDFDRVDWMGSYTQADAPVIYQSCDVLVHLKHMDWTPNVVAEAMACGLPIVHTGNGGVPEITGAAGVSLEITEDWDQIQSSEIAAVAEKVVEAYEKRRLLGEAARSIAAERYSMETWVAVHQEIFLELLDHA